LSTCLAVAVLRATMGGKVEREHELAQRVYIAVKEAARAVSEMCIGTPLNDRPGKVGNPDNYEGYCFEANR